MDRGQSPETQQRHGAIALPGDTQLTVKSDTSCSRNEDNTRDNAEHVMALEHSDKRPAFETQRWHSMDSEGDDRGQTTHYWLGDAQLSWRKRIFDRRRLWEFVRNHRWFVGMTTFSMVMGAVMWAYRKELLEALENLSKAVRDMGASGYFLLSLLIFLSAFPPMIGYGTYQTLSGFTFGFARGFPISYFSALLGGVTCFVLARLWLKDRVHHWMTRYPNLQAVVHAVEKRGFKLFLLIRLSPYPFNLLNVLFASTDISLKQYTLGTALSLTKIALHVYIGANLTSFAKHVLGEDEDMTESDRRAETTRMIAMVIGSTLAIVVMVYVYIVAKRAVEQANRGESEEEAMAFLSQEPTRGDYLEDWTEWHDDDDDNVSEHSLQEQRSGA